MDAFHENWGKVVRKLCVKETETKASTRDMRKRFLVSLVLLKKLHTSDFNLMAWNRNKINQSDFLCERKSALGRG